mmetsp:Transcript_14583/g.39012  ORF Transcript_14583/g.39012 Transcript_14583/m.39012 type:complete len:142 (-) Transcript_14583:16-441(-)
MAARYVSPSAGAARSLFRRYLRFAHKFPIEPLGTKMRANVVDAFEFRAWQARAVGAVETEDVAEKIFEQWRREAEESLDTVSKLLDLPADTLDTILNFDYHSVAKSKVLYRNELRSPKKTGTRGRAGATTAASSERSNPVS